MFDYKPVASRTQRARIAAAEDIDASPALKEFMAGLTSRELQLVGHFFRHPDRLSEPEFRNWLLAQTLPGDFEMIETLLAIVRTGQRPVAKH